MLFPKKTVSSERGVQLAGVYANRANAKNPFVTFLDIQESQQKSVLQDAPLVVWDLQKSINAQVTLGGNRTLALHNLIEGDYGTLVIIQDAGGNRSLELPTSYTNYVANGGAGVITLSTAPGAQDIVSFYFDGTSVFWNINTGYTSK